MKNLPFLALALLITSPAYCQTTDYIPYFTNSMGTLGNSVMYQSGSDIGVGTTTPSYVLDVQGTGSAILRGYSNTSSIADVDVQNGNTGTGGNGVDLRLITENSGGTGLAVVDMVKYANGYLGFNNSDTSGLIAFGTAGTERMRITSGGNVGIGTTSPRGGATLDVNGSLNANSFTLNALPVPLPAGGRLTLTSNAPVMTSDAVAATVLYYADYVSDLVPIYNGTNWVEYSLGGQISLTFDDTTSHTGYQASGKIFDVVAYNNSGTPQLCTGPAWTNLTTRASAIALQNGIWTNSGSWTLKCDTSSSTYTCSTNQCTYLGSVYIPAATTTLGAAITTTTQTAITFSSATGTGTYPFPAYGSYYIKIDSEVMLVTAGQSTTSITVTRAQRGTTAATHSNGATVTMDAGQTSVQMNVTSASYAPAAPAGGSCNLVGLYNAYNHVSFPVLESDGSTSWTYSTTLTWRQANNSACNQIVVLDGLGQMFVKNSYQSATANSTAAGKCVIGIGQNQTTDSGVQFQHSSDSAGSRGSGATEQTFLPVLGLSYYAALEYDTTGTCTTYPEYLAFSLESTVND